MGETGKNGAWLPAPEAAAKLDAANAIIETTLLPDSEIDKLAVVITAARHALNHGCVGPQIEQILLEGGA